MKMHYLICAFFVAAPSLNYAMEKDSEKDDDLSVFIKSVHQIFLRKTASRLKRSFGNPASTVPSLEKLDPLPSIPESPLEENHCSKTEG